MLCERGFCGETPSSSYGQLRTSCSKNALEEIHTQAHAPCTSARQLIPELTHGSTVTVVGAQAYVLVGCKFGKASGMIDSAGGVLLILDRWEQLKAQ